MAQDDDLFSRADSLLNAAPAAGLASAAPRRLPRRQRRSFVAAPEAALPRTNCFDAGEGASSGESLPEMPSEESAAIQDLDELELVDDLPVLTDVVLPSAAVAAEEMASAIESDLSAIAHTLRATLAADLAEALDRQLASELPALVDALLRETTSQLRNSIDTAIAEALRDFVAERGQLRLPLPAPEASVGWGELANPNISPSPAQPVQLPSE